jgi:biopolymer transport protein ExbD
MRFRHGGHIPAKVELQMAPMIDVVFLLLIFFMLTLKVIAPEGDFNLKMPLIAPGPAANELTLPNVKVRLIADEKGALQQIRLGQRSLPGVGALSQEILALLGGQPGGPLSEELEVEIDADFRLHYEYVMQAISACTGQVVEDPPGSGQTKIVRLIEKIKFAPPREPSGS